MKSLFFYFIGLMLLTSSIALASFGYLAEPGTETSTRTTKSADIIDELFVLDQQTVTTTVTRDSVNSAAYQLPAEVNDHKLSPYRLEMLVNQRSFENQEKDYVFAESAVTAGADFPNWLRPIFYLHETVTLHTLSFEPESQKFQYSAPEEQRATLIDSKTLTLLWILTLLAGLFFYIKRKHKPGPFNIVIAILYLLSVIAFVDALALNLSLLWLTSLSLVSLSLFATLLCDPDPNKASNVTWVLRLFAGFFHGVWFLVIFSVISEPLSKLGWQYLPQLTGTIIITMSYGVLPAMALIWLGKKIFQKQPEEAEPITN